MRLRRRVFAFLLERKKERAWVLSWERMACRVGGGGTFKDAEKSACSVARGVEASVPFFLQAVQDPCCRAHLIVAKAARHDEVASAPSGGGKRACGRRAGRRASSTHSNSIFTQFCT